MKIVMLTYYYWPVHAGGAEKQCRKLSAALFRRGHSCTILTCRHKLADPPIQHDENGMKIIRQPTLEIILRKLGAISKERTESPGLAGRWSESSAGKKNEKNFANSFRILMAKWASLAMRYGNIAVFSLGVLLFLGRKRKSVDIVHVHTAEWIAGLAALAGKLFNVPVLCKGANIPVFPKLHAVPLASLCDSLRRKPHFIALTQAMKDDLVQHGVAADRIAVIPNGVNIPVQASAVEQNYHFLYIGNFNQSAAHKGFDVLLSAWAKFHDLRPEARLLLVGGGNAEPWRSAAEDLGCAGSIDFAGYQTNLTPFFAKACCILLPSRKEGISNALLEAQSWGIPAIASDIPGNRAVVMHGMSGILVPVGDSAALAEAMRFLHDSKAVRREYGQTARRRMKDVFDMNKVVDQTLELYQQLSP